MKRLALVLAAVALVAALLQFGPFGEAGSWSPAGEALTEAPEDHGSPGENLTAAGTQRPDESGAPEREELSQAASGRVQVRGRLVDLEGERIAGQTVRLHLGTGSARSRYGMSMGAKNKKPADQVAKTDAKGRFEFEVPATKGGQVSLADGDLVWAKRPPRFLASGEDLDLGNLTIQRGAMLKGSIIDDANQPVGKAKVQFASYENFQFRSQRTATSDAQGGFELRGLPGGQATLSISCAEHVSCRMTIELALGKTRDKVIVRLNRGRELTGIVVDDRWQPVSGASVNVTGPGHKTEDGYEYSRGSTKTDAKGEFRVSSLGKGPFRVRAQAKGHTSASLKGVKEDARQVRVEIKRLGTVAGRLVDERGQPIADSKIRWTTKAPGKNSRRNADGYSGFATAVHLDHNEQMLHRQRGGIKTDEDGRFVLENVRAGQVFVVATGVHQQAVEGPLVVSPGEQTKGVQMSARRGAVARIRVLDPKRQPLAGIRVALRPQKSGQPKLVLGGWRETATTQRPTTARGRTDKNGECELAGVEPGDYEVAASHKSWVSPKPEVIRMPSKGLVESELVLQRGGHVAIRIVDHAGQPLPAQKFRLRRGDKSVKTGRSDATGRARVGPLAAGEYQAALEPGSSTVAMFFGDNFGKKGKELGPRVPFQVQVDKTADVLLQRPELASVTGTVRDAGGMVVNAMVVLTPSSRGKPGLFNYAMINSMQQGRTNEHGVFEFSALQDGSYSLSVRRDRKGMPFVQAVDIKGPDTHHQDVFLATGTVDVVLRTDGAAAGDVRVRLQPSRMNISPYMWLGGDVGQRSTATTNDKGVAHFAKIPPGEYTVNILSGRFATPDTGSRQVKVSAGAAARKELALEKAAALEITGVPADGTAKPRMYLVEITHEGDSKSRPRDHWLSRTTQMIKKLRAGRVSIRARRRAKNGMGEWSKAQTVELAAGKRQPVRIILP